MPISSELLHERLRNEQLFNTIAGMRRYILTYCLAHDVEHDRWLHGAADMANAAIGPVARECDKPIGVNDD